MLLPPGRRGAGGCWLVLVTGCLLAGALADLHRAAVVSYHDPSSDVSRRLKRACDSEPLACTEGAVLDLVDRTLSPGSYQLTSAISLEPAVPGGVPGGVPAGESSSSQKNIGEGRGSRVDARRPVIEPHEVAEHIVDRMDRFARGHVVKVKLGQLARELSTGEQPKLFGKNSFLTGFGLGFLAFGLKKLLLPFFIGAQIVKSILIAMFLPSILGSVGKLVGKGVTTFATSSAQNGGFSGSSSGGNALGGGDNMEDFDFKDNGAAGQYPDAASSGSEFMPSYATLAAPPAGFNALQTIQRPSQDSGDGQPLGTLPAMFQAAASAASNVLANRYQPKNSYAHRHQNTIDGGLGSSSGSFYNRNKPHDFKTFQNIPSSSMLLTHYDPFYSPLLSRLDSVFHQLGYSSEPCRERLVCAMYRNPAKFAPFSNLVSAQLSRELNELRKPSSDNPEILRFFRYMKAAKDGQDNQDCNLVYATCTQTDASQASPMAYTFQDINKLVQARRLSRNLARPIATPQGPGAGSPSPAPAPASQPPISAAAGYQSDNKDVSNASTPAKVLESAEKSGAVTAA